MTEAETLFVPKFLPPGLHVMLPEEDTERFRRENMARDDLTEEELLDFGIFVVTLACLDPERVSVMPNRSDLQSLYKAGFGLTVDRLQTAYGGLLKLQSNLKFWSRGFISSQDDLIERYKWIHATYSSDMGYEAGCDPGIISAWGSARNLSPAYRIAVQILGGDLSEISLIFDVGTKRKARIDKRKIYTFAQRVIDENGRPVTSDHLRRFYRGSLLVSADSAVLETVGSFDSLWGEFGYTSGSVKGLSDDEIVDRAVRLQIRNGPTKFTVNSIRELSAAKRFVSPSLIFRKGAFEGVVHFDELARGGYQLYVGLEDEFAESGVERDLFRAINRCFSLNESYLTDLKIRIELMRKISVDDFRSKYIAALIMNGLDLRHDETYDMQLCDLFKYLELLGINDEADVRWILDKIPRLDPDEAIAQVGWQADRKGPKTLIETIPDVTENLAYFGVSLDDRGNVTRGDVSVHLMPVHARILKTLAYYRGESVAYDEIAQKSWSAERAPGVTKKYIQEQIGILRAAVRDLGLNIVLQDRKGYRLELADSKIDTSQN